MFGEGMDVFHNYFSEYPDQYVLIGGAACDLSFHEDLMDFRVTRDLDMVLVVEALTKEFADRFWEFIRDGKYHNRLKSNGCPQFYRFEKPEATGYPEMIELFSRVEWKTSCDSVLAPIHVEADVPSLSAILLDDTYYELLLRERDIIDGISVLKPSALIAFKIKAWLDMNQTIERGQHIDSRNLKKHRNDILRISSMLPLEPCRLPIEIQKDIEAFLEKVEISDEELKNLKISGVKGIDISMALRKAFFL